MQSARYSVFAIALLAGASFAGCSGSPSVNHAAAAGATSVAGNAGLDGTIEPSLPASAGSGAQGGSLFVDLPETMAGSTSVGGSTSQPYPDKLPDGFTAANMFGGFRVGEAIVAESGSPAETPSAGTERCGTTILAVIRDFKVDGENFGGKSIGDDKGLVEPTLGADRKPVFAHSGPSSTVTDPAEFDNWYRTVDGVNKAYKLELWFGPNAGVSSFQSTDFFPLDGMGWNDMDPEFQHNFYFTTEIHTQFRYEGGETFKFVGDDDVWVFINSRLAIDLGGVHPAAEATIDIDARATELGLEKGKVYPFDMFQTERHKFQSNFRADTDLNFVDCGTIVPETIPK